MSEAKHTPGPWEVVYVHGVALGVGTPEPSPIGLIFKMIGNSLGKKSGQALLPDIEANARLIAAAPDLLAALKALADRVDATSDCDHTRLSCEEIGCIGVEVAAARDAIARATGKTP